MKRLPLVQKDDPKGRHYYQTIAERDRDPSVLAAKAREFQVDRPDEPASYATPDGGTGGVDRRTFMSLMGASMALAGLAGCRRPEEKIVPFAHQPEDTLPGRPEFFATSMPFYGTAIGLVVESNDGRPTKIEGNKAHPETPRGATSSFIQGHVLNLYDPDRSKAPRNAGKDTTMEEAMTALQKLSKELIATKGKGLGVIVTEHRSWTTLNGLIELGASMPAAEIKNQDGSVVKPLVKHDPFGRANARIATKSAFNDNAQDADVLETVHDLSKASVIVAFDSDFLGLEGSPMKASAGFAANRSVEKGNMSRFYVAEPCPTITSNACDHRLRTQARRMTLLLRALVSELASKHNVQIDGALGAASQLTDVEKKWVTAAAKDLATARHKALVIVGRRQLPAAHALGIAINHALASGCVSYKRSFDHATEETNNSLKKLCDAARAGQITTLVILGGNPVFTAPADLNFAEVMGKVKTTIHLSSHVDETSALATWHIPRAHELESWGDTVSEDGTISIMQPLISPMYDGKTDAEILHRLLGGVLGAYELTRRTIDRMLTPVGALPPSVAGDGAAPPAAPPVDLEKRWRRALFDGVVQASPPGYDTIPVLNKPNIVSLLSAQPADGFEVVFAPCPHAYDGRYANNGWLQETPHPIHKSTWTNVASVSSATAKKLGVAEGDLVKVQVGDSSIDIPVAIAYGHADESVTVYVGQGRKFAGSVCKGVGVDAGPIRKGATWDIATGSVTKGTGKVTLAITQGHFTMEGRPLIREQTVREYKEDPSYARDLVISAEAKHEIENIYGEDMPWDYSKGHKWGMTIDLATCTGCSSCLTACVAENNISVVGAEGVHKSREMHWIRIDRYFAGKEGVPTENEDDVDASIMPMLCQHCENAPCEQVCPVAATTHSPEGINEMTYNRCIGTKYCGNNCPFKVRRFNFFHYTKEIPETLKLQLNPDVTVRSRGVMEKCSFCVQRVQEAKIASKRVSDARKDLDEKGRDKVRVQYVRDELVSACQQACPTGAITFGDLNDPVSAVTQTAAYTRRFQMLEEINVRPRVMYLGKIRNPNEDLEPPKPKPEGAKPHKTEGESHGSEKH